jgi:hypothetical protein
VSTILVATHNGVLAFGPRGQPQRELAAKSTWTLAPAGGGACFAVANGGEIWRRSAAGKWSLEATAPGALAALECVDGAIYCGAMKEAALHRVIRGGALERLRGFDATPGRDTWIPQGPPLHVRAVTATADRSALFAAVHVGGIPRSTDGGATWQPTIPVMDDVHEVRAHAKRPLVAAACAVGLYVSEDAGATWARYAEGLEVTDGLAVAHLDDRVLFSAQDGPFATRAQVWSWSPADRRLRQVRDGLPEWLDGKVDTGHIAAAGGRAAVLDGGGTLWVSARGATGWRPRATGLVASWCVRII